MKLFLTAQFKPLGLKFGLTKKQNLVGVISGNINT
jgi:hypothetical protein